MLSAPFPRGAQPTKWLGIVLKCMSLEKRRTLPKASKSLPIMHYELTQLGRVPMAWPPRAAFQATPASASPRATSWVPHSSLLIPLSSLLSPLSSLLIMHCALCIMHCALSIEPPPEALLKIFSKKKCRKILPIRKVAVTLQSLCGRSGPSGPCFFDPGAEQEH